MLLGIYMAVCYGIVKSVRSQSQSVEESERVRCCSLFQFHFEDYPVHVYAYCVVDTQCYPNI